MPKRFAAAQLERVESIGASKREHGAGPELCAAHQIFGAFERAARRSRLYDSFDVAIAQACDESEAETQRVIVLGEAPLILSFSRKGRRDAVSPLAGEGLGVRGRKPKG